MHHYLEFMEECERLKDIFLLEGEDEKKDEKNDDLAELDDGADKDIPEDTEDNPEDDEETSGEENESDDDIDLDLDGDLGDITGDDDLDPEAEDVNAEEKPGAVNPGTLYQEITQGEDNIYDRTAKAALEKFPNGKCEVKDMLPIIAIGIKSYMKNKNYAPIPKADMKKLVFRIAHDIHDKLTSEKKEPSRPEKSATEAIFYRKDELALMEGWKELALAGAIAAAPMAGHAATAESAPYNTHANTSKIITNNRSMSADSREMVHTKDNYGGKVRYTSTSGKKVGTTSKPATQGGGAADVPIVSDYSIVDFDEGTTYQVTPEQLEKMQADGNVPAKYQVLDKNAKGKTAAKTGAKSTTQQAVKAQAKAQANAPTGACKVDSEKCGCQKPHDDVDLELLAHKAGHKAVDLGIKGAKTAWGGLKGAATGLWSGAKKAWNSSDRDIEHDHDQMIAGRGK